MKIDLKNKYQIILILSVSIICFMAAMVLLSPRTQQPGGHDADKDTIIDAKDNCPGVPNSDQSDVDDDGTGDVCDLCTDTDGDGMGNAGYPQNTCPEDNCPDTSNTNQTDTDHDSIGDACDECPDDPLNDADNDDICGSVDNCPSVNNPGQADADADGIGDACETPPTVKFTVTPTEPCVGERIQFWDNTSIGGGVVEQWRWSFGDNTSSSDRHPNHTYQTVGSYSVQLIVTDMNGKTSMTTTNVVVLDNDPPGVPAISGPALETMGSNATFTVKATDPDGNQMYYMIDWGDDTGITSLGPYRSGYEAKGYHRWITPGRYTVTVTARDSHNAESTSASCMIRITDLYLLYPNFREFFDQHHSLVLFTLLYT